MTLNEFQPCVGNPNAYSIKAADLDENFSKLKPKSNGTYGIEESTDGWSFNIFPAFPQKVTKPVVLTFNGQKAGTPSAPIGTAQIGLHWLPITAGWLSITAGWFNTVGVDAGAVFTSDGIGGAYWNLPPSGEAAWRQVERCDGKKMWVWGTDWE